MHAGGGTNDRGEKRNVLIVGVLLLIVVEYADRLFGRDFAFYVCFLTEIEPYTERRAAQ